MSLRQFSPSFSLNTALSQRCGVRGAALRCCTAPAPGSSQRAPSARSRGCEKKIAAGNRSEYGLQEWRAAARIIVRPAPAISKAESRSDKLTRQLGGVQNSPGVVPSCHRTPARPNITITRLFSPFGTRTRLQQTQPETRSRQPRQEEHDVLSTHLGALSDLGLDPNPFSSLSSLITDPPANPVPA